MPVNPVAHQLSAQKEATRQAQPENKVLSVGQAGHRAGYTNATRLTFLPPKSVKREKSWQNKMKQKGYRFAGEEQ
jgi:hypothetical protein